MINVAEYLAFVQERQNTFDQKCNALRVNQDYISLAALYMDILTSSVGEKWDTTTLLIELDDILEELRQRKVLYYGKEISARGTSLDDPNILQYKTVVDKTRTVVDDEGNKSKVKDGKRETTKKKHIHSETKMIIDLPKTNAYGIPECHIYGEYHDGLYAFISPANGLIVPHRDVALKVINATKKTIEHYKQHAPIAKNFLHEIEDRCKYGLASLLELRVIGAPNDKPAGLIRIDYDMFDRATVIGLAYCFDGRQLLAGNISEHNLIANTTAFLKNILEDHCIDIAPGCHPRVFVEGTYQQFKDALDRRQKIQEENVRLALDKQEKLRKALEENEKREAAELERKRIEREEEKKRLKAERERERREREAQKADKDAKKHQKALEGVMTTLVKNILEAGQTPGRAVYQEMLDGIYADIQTGGADVDDMELVIEALETLKAQDTNA